VYENADGGLAHWEEFEDAIVVVVVVEEAAVVPH
jgi:hypothetical protein